MKPLRWKEERGKKRGKEKCATYNHDFDGFDDK